MKLKKKDYMRLPKERLAELLVERDNEVIQPIVIPSQPAPSDPWRNPYPPTITYTDSPNTNDTKGLVLSFLDTLEEPKIVDGEDETELNSLAYLEQLGYTCIPPLNDQDMAQEKWKPIPEQLEAMEFVIRDYREDGCTATANYLQEILDQIKKL